MAATDARPAFRAWPKIKHAHNVITAARKSVRRKLEEARRAEAEAAGNEPAAPAEPAALAGNEMEAVEAAELRSRDITTQLRFKAKIKLHGTNSGVCGWVDKDMEGVSIGDGVAGVVGMSRKRFLWPEAQDNDGFRDDWLDSKPVAEFWAAFFEALPAPFGLVPGVSRVQVRPAQDSVRRVEVFGEWSGDGIQKSATAVSHLPHKLYAVFAIRYTGEDGRRRVIVEPDTIEQLLADGAAAAGLAVPQEIRVLPWHVADDAVAARVNAELAQLPVIMDEAALAKAAEDMASGEWHIDLAAPLAIRAQLTAVSSLTETIDKADPYIAAEFGVDGAGEGLVFYPTSLAEGGGDGTNEPVHLPSWAIEKLMFKAKGESHRVTRAAAAAHFEIKSFDDASSFVQYFLTQPRLFQGRSEVANSAFNPEDVDAFVEWVSLDVYKESIDERATSPNVTLDDINALIDQRARAWFLSAGEETEGTSVVKKKGKKKGKKGKK